MTSLRHTLPLFAALTFCLVAPTSLSAQKDKKMGEDKGMEKKDEDGRSKDEDERRRRQREAGTRSIPELPEIGNLNEMISNEKARATEVASKINLKGKTKTRYVDDWVDVIKTNHGLLEKAHERRKVIISAMAREVETMTGKKIKDFGTAEIQLLNNYYGAASLPPTAYRRVSRMANEDGDMPRDNPFSLLVKELGKDLATVKASVEKIRSLIEEDNPWAIYQKMNKNRDGFEGTVKTFLRPEEYFEYLKVMGRDQRPDNEVEVGAKRFRDALRGLAITEDQRRAIRRVLINPNLDADMKRDQINEILGKEQLRRLQEELGEIEKASDEKKPEEMGSETDKK